MAKENNQLEDHDDLLEVVLLDNVEKGIQYRMTVSEFRGKLYIGIREWYEGWEGELLPSRNGMTLPYSLHTSARLFSGLKGLLSEAEVLQDVLEEVKNYEND